ncbi:MAG: ABC transporter substrate-binding protein [Hyphomicrobiaceae bacterium]
MIRKRTRQVAWLALSAALAASSGVAAKDEPKRGGILKFVVPDEPPSFDGHRETTFALIHPIAPFYSVLIRVNPNNPASLTDFVCDLCTEMPKPTDGGKTYTFKIRKGVKFHDGAPMTAKDVEATYQHIVFPGEGVLSARKAQFSMIESVTSPDDETVVFKLKHPSGAFIPVLANPYNFVYSKEKLAADPRWYEKNVVGTGPFVFDKREAGARITGKANKDYYHKGLPYLDGFEAIFAKKQSLRVQAIRGDQAAIEFRGFPPKSRDDLVRALGKDITVQESDWNCGLVLTPNHSRKPFDDVRVRRALTLALDRWGGSKDLSKIAIVKAAGGLVFPGHPLGLSADELHKVAGYWPDIEKSRAEARRLLKEAGHPNLSFTFLNRATDQPYTIVGTWMIDQWKKVGITAKMRNEATAGWFAGLRAGDFDVGVTANCQSVVNPLLDVAYYLPTGRSGQQMGVFKDPELEKIYDKMITLGDEAEQKRLMAQYEKRVMDEEAHNFQIFWWYRIIPHRSYLKGWKISPSHYLNQDLSGLWIDHDS